jgi:hypothetical protein
MTGLSGRNAAREIAKTLQPISSVRPCHESAPGVSVLVAIAALSHGACARSNPPVPFGFGQESGRAELALEARFRDLARRHADSRRAPAPDICGHTLLIAARS